MRFLRSFSRKFTAFLLFLFFPVLALFPQTGFPSLEPVREAAVYAGYFRDGADWQQCWDASVWASALNEPHKGGEAAAAKMKDAVAALLADPNLPANPSERGEFVLHFMHERYLRRYVELQTRVDDIFINGTYNCVSSAAFYLCLAKAAGLSVQGVMTADHAFITLVDGQNKIDIETTNAFGFDPGGRKDFHDDFGKVTGFAYVPARNYRGRAQISEIELISLILSNRITILERQKRYPDAIALAVNREALLKGRPMPCESPLFQDPRTVTLDRLNNYAALMIQQRKEEDCLAWVDYAAPYYPGDPRWNEISFAAVNNLVARNLSSRRVKEARTILDGNRARLTEPQYKGLATQVLLSEVNQISATAGNLEAIAFLEAAVLQYGETKETRQVASNLKHNRISELHNGFAALYNRRRYDEAHAAILKALEEYPGESSLTKDLRLVEAALGKR
jgi:hypothetical protein